MLSLLIVLAILVAVVIGYKTKINTGLVFNWSFFDGTET